MSVVPLVAGLLMAAAYWLVSADAQRAPYRRSPGRRPRWPRGRPTAHAGARVSELADIAELLAVALSGGCGLIEALELVGARYPGVLGQHLRTVAAAARWGLDEDAQWSAVPPEWAPIRGALGLAAEAGIPPAQALIAVAEDVRRREAHRVEVAAAKFGAKAVLPLGLAFLPAFVLTTVAPVVVLLAGDVLG